MTPHRQVISEHYEWVWGATEARFALGKGPVRELGLEFEVLRFHRGEAVTVFATCGMSRATDEEGLELHILVHDGDAARAAYSVIELLTAAAHFHRTGAKLGMGHTVNFGRSWVPEAACTHGLLSLPYLDGPRLEWLEKPRVRFLWLIPITIQELEFKKAHGLDALEKRFEESQFDYLDPGRASVC